MATTFGATTLLGTVGDPKVGEWGFGLTETTYFDVEGVSAITGQLQGREITCEHWLHSNYSSRALAEAAYLALQALIGQTRTLTAGNGEVFRNCLLVSLQRNEGPAKHDPLNWMFVLTWRWRQLKK